MARRNQPQVQPEEAKCLLRPRTEVEQKIDEQIAIGERLKSVQPKSPGEVTQWTSEYRQWFSFTEELLRTLIKPGSVADEFAGHGIAYFGMLGGRTPTFLEDVEDRRTTVVRCFERLAVIRNKVQLWPEAPGAVTTSPSQDRPIPSTNKVFIVHGHDDAAKLAVENCLRKLGLEPIVLRDQPNRGQTIIEKLLRHTADVAFAIVLLTGDDVGAEKNTASDLVPRARQNVILELGLFIGALGRDRVCPLLADGVEKPSDYDGVVYVRYDAPEGPWRYELAKELKAAGLDADLNRL